MESDYLLNGLFFGMDLLGIDVECTLPERVFVSRAVVLGEVLTRPGLCKLNPGALLVFSLVGSPLPTISTVLVQGHPRGGL